MDAELIVPTGEFFVPGRCGRWTEELHRARYKFARDYVVGKDVLDIACGLGYGSAALASAGARSVVGVDIRADNVSHAEQEYGSDKVRFNQGDITTYGEDESFDVVVCFETIEHISSYNAAIRNCKRILRKGGLLLVSSPNRTLSSPRLKLVTGTPENRFHIREFTESELLLLVEAAGFQVDGSDIFGQAFQLVMPGSLLTKALRKCVIRPFGETKVLPNRQTLSKPNYFLLRARNDDPNRSGERN